MTTSPNPPTPFTKPVAIAGGGLAGLTALAYLARAGVPAILFERSASLGGRARTETVNGYSLNLGAHALYRKGLGMRVLKELAIPFSGNMPAPTGYAIDGDTMHTLPAGFVSMLSTNLLRLPAKLELARVFARIRAMSDREMPEVSMAEWIETNVADADLRRFMLMTVRVTTYVADARTIAARSALTQIRLGLFGGVLYVDGGWQTLVEGLRRAAVAAGGKIVTGARVSAIEYEGAGAAGAGVGSAGASAARAVVLEDGSRIEVSAVILAVPPKAAAEVAGDAARAELVEASERAVPAGAACLDLALRRVPVPRVRFALGLDRPTYFSVHSWSAKLAPAGGAVVHAMKYLAPDDASTPAENERELEALMDRLQPGWRDEVVERRFLPRMTVVHGVLPPRSAKRRHGVRVESVANVFVAGDWVGDEAHLADASLASGREAAHAALGVRSAPIARSAEAAA